MAWLNLKLPFKITGKLKTTPEQAKRIFDFEMKPGATGIILQRCGNRIFIRNAMPPAPIRTKYHKMQVENIRKMNKIASSILMDIIRPVWNPLIGKRYFSGYNMFLSVNLKRISIPPQWKKLLLTDGKLRPPQIASAVRKRRKIILQIANTKLNNKIGIGALDTVKFTFWHQEPRKWEKGKVTLKLPLGMYNVIIYVYFKQDNQYSSSTSTHCKDSGYTKF